MVYNSIMHDIPTITLTAKRVSTAIHKGDLIVFAYGPTPASLKALTFVNTSTHPAPVFRLDLEDETGSWTSGAMWLIVEFEHETSYSTTTLRMVLAKAKAK
jgi:hypothetical protein